MVQAHTTNGFRTYRVLKHIFVGQTAGGATSNATSIVDTNVALTFDPTKVIKYRTTNTSTLTTTLGTKVGIGTEATGKNSVTMMFGGTSGTNTVAFRGVVQLYGCTLLSNFSGGTQALQFISQTTGAGSGMFNCIFQGFSGYVLGSSGAFVDTMYNVDITGDPSAIAGVITSFFVTTAERITVGTSSGGYMMLSATSGITMKDCALFGTPALASFNSTGADVGWKLVRPVWASGVNKFNGTGTTVGGTGGPHEYWMFDAKVVNGAGTAISGVPIRLTDTLGNVQVDTTTGSNGEIAFGSGLTASAVITVDWSGSGAGGTLTAGHRSPFLCEVNLPTMTSYNSNYQSKRFYFNWPGYETVTTSAGSFEDVNMVISLSDPTGTPTIWTEASL